LPARRTAYCSDAHAREFVRNHVWSAARQAARRRAKWTCQRCGFRPAEVRRDPDARKAFRRHELRLEVNHILPLRGAYRVVTCANHLTNLEVLCHRCHNAATAAQRRTAGAR
jgi:5-methylcytosine-specific restriction endonuclease McrA